MSVAKSLQEAIIYFSNPDWSLMVSHNSCHIYNDAALEAML
jgi:hypothetical protein